MAHPARPEALYNQRIGEIGKHHAQHRAAENPEEVLSAPECLADQLLRGIEPTKQAAKHQTAAQHIANRLTIEERSAHIAPNRAQIDGLDILISERLRQAQPHPHSDNPASNRHAQKNRLPSRQH